MRNKTFNALIENLKEVKNVWFEDPTDNTVSRTNKK